MGKVKTQIILWASLVGVPFGSGFAGGPAGAARRCGARCGKCPGRQRAASDQPLETPSPPQRCVPRLAPHWFRASGEGGSTVVHHPCRYKPLQSLQEEFCRPFFIPFQTLPRLLVKVLKST